MFGWTPLHYLKAVIRLLEHIQREHPGELVYIKNKHREPLKPSLLTLAKVFKSSLTVYERNLLASVDDLSCSGSIEENVRKQDECYFLQDGSSIDKCRVLGAQTILAVGPNGRTFNYMGAGERLGTIRRSMRGDTAIVFI